MKIDMSPEAVTRRLKTAAELRRLCLALADSSAGREIRGKFHDEPQVRRTDEALPPIKLNPTSIHKTNGRG